jgi:serine/threonine-protein kinase
MRTLAFVMLLSGAAFADGFAAVAYSPSTGATGAAWNYSCAGEAQESAMGACEQADCTSPMWVENGCIALAKGSGGWGWAWNGDRGLARYQALQSCSNYGSGCHIVQSACSF